MLRTSKTNSILSQLIALKRMTNEERWDAFIVELRDYIEEHHHGANKHTDLYNRTRYYRRILRLAQEPLSPKMAERKRVLEDILNMRDFSEHTGGRKRKQL